MSQDNMIKLECTECKRINYFSRKNKKTIKERYPDDWKEIVKCIEDKIEAGFEGEELEDEIDKCLQSIAIITPEDRCQLKTRPRTFLTVPGG